MKKIEAKILADSINSQGDRIGVIILRDFYHIDI